MFMPGVSVGRGVHWGDTPDAVSGEQYMPALIPSYQDPVVIPSTSVVQSVSLYTKTNISLKHVKALKYVHTNQKDQRLFQFEIIINVLVCSSRVI